MKFVHQAPGKRLELIRCIKNKANSHTIKFNASMKDRFTISGLNDNNILCLPMTRLRAEDMARYYCTRGIVKGLQCEHLNKPPFNDAESQKGAISPHEALVLLQEQMQT
jgi:hypothetical protein